MKHIKHVYLIQYPVRVTMATTGFVTILSVAVTWLGCTLLGGKSSFGSMSLTMAIAVPVIITPIVSCFVFTLLRELAEAYKVMERMAQTDNLTQALTRGWLFERGNGVLKKARERSSSIGLLVIDFDHFKRINDTLGHDAGDKVLVEISNIIRANIRADDLYGRLGGEEFLVICPGCDHQAIYSKAKQINEAVRDHTVGYGEEEIRVTVSIGATMLHKEWACDLKNLITRTDKLLYAAKNAGRDKVVLCCSSYTQGIA